MVIDFSNDAQVMLAQMTVTGIAQEKETILQKAEQLSNVHCCPIYVWHNGTRIASIGQDERTPRQARDGTDI